MTDKEKRELKDGVISIFKRFNILDQTATIGGLRDDILRYINSLQEEPVSIWHKPHEKPFNKSKVIVWTGDEMVQCHYIYGKFKEKTPTEECGYNVDIKSSEGCGNLYVSKKKRADLTDLVEKWAYIDDIINLSSVQRTVKDWKEEPVSESIDFEQELYKAFGQIKDFTLGVAIAKRFYAMGRKHNEPVSEELEEAASSFARKDSEGISNPVNFYYTIADKARVFKAGIEWHKKRLIKEAIDGIARPDDGEVWCDLKSFNFKDGDKCKVILIKEK